MAPSLQQPLDRGFDEHRLIEQLLDLHAGRRRCARHRASASFTPLTTASVDALPFLMTLSSTERRPSVRTMFCCTA